MEDLGATALKTTAWEAGIARMFNRQITHVKEILESPRLVVKQFCVELHENVRSRNFRERFLYHVPFLGGGGMLWLGILIGAEPFLSYNDLKIKCSSFAEPSTGSKGILNGTLYPFIQVSSWRRFFIDSFRTVGAIEDQMEGWDVGALLNNHCGARRERNNIHFLANA